MHIIGEEHSLILWTARRRLIWRRPSREEISAAARTEEAIDRAYADSVLATPDKEIPRQQFASVAPFRLQCGGAMHGGKPSRTSG
jgi:hypothetical protein